MKKTLVLFILSLFLFSNTGLREMVKLPVLFAHYFEHKELDSSITFLTYLMDHYNSVPHTDNDEDRDNQLPFKSVHFAGVFSPAIATIYISQLKKPVAAVIKGQHPVYTDCFVPGAAGGKIWQPPKSGSVFIV